MASSTARTGIRRTRNRFSFGTVKEAIGAYGMIAPFFILLGVFTFYVFYKGFWMGFSDAQGLNEGEFIGLQNYKDILYADEFKSRDFWRAVKTTFKFMFGCLATQVPVAFVLAFVLNHIPLVRLRGLLRSAFFLPVLLNTVVVALLFRMFFLRDTGIINSVFGFLHLPNQTDWLGNSAWAISLLVAVSFWQWTGFHMVYFLAQLQTIDPTLYEAAKLDGASPLRVLFKLTLPLMRPAITFVMVTSAIGGLQMFDLVFVLFPNANYGPGGAAMTLVAFIYDQGFSQEFLTGYATASGWLTFLIIMIFSLFQLKLFGLGKHDEA
jgi:ABC-type sugar transport system permease subunit